MNRTRSNSDQFTISLLSLAAEGSRKREYCLLLKQFPFLPVGGPLSPTETKRIRVLGYVLRAVGFGKGLFGNRLPFFQDLDPAL